MSENGTTVQQTIQLTGGSTYTVSLPKEWAETNGIDPGTSVDLHTRGDRLVLMREHDPRNGSRETAIDAAVGEPATLGLSVAAAYIAGCERVTVENLSPRDSEARRAVRRSVRRFVGFEVMSESNSGLSARTLLDVADLSPEQTLAQLERTALEMHTRSVEALVTADGALGERVADRDDTVDRLFALLSRGFQRSLVDPAVTVEGDRSPFGYDTTARRCERVADHVERMATLAGRLTDPPPALSAEFVSLSDRSRAVVRRAVDSSLGRERDVTPGGVVTDAEQLLDDLAALDEQLYEQQPADGYLLGLVVDSLVRTAECGVNVAETGMQARHRAEHR
jgi:Phosphate uptake regulator